MLTIQNERELIISLIKDDLINQKLVNGLEDLGLSAGDYLLHASTMVFKLMGIAETGINEYIFEQYLNLSEKVKEVDVTEGHYKLDALAEEIYAYLLHEKARL